MSKVIIIGAGFAGHTAALYLGDALGKDHEITVVSNRDQFSFIPSWVWVAVGHMKLEKTQFPLKPVYDKMHVNFVYGKAVEIHPDEGDQFITVEMRDGSNETRKLDYDYLVVATGPKLDFAATPGLGPDHGYTYSICTGPHAVETAEKYAEMVKRAKAGEKLTFVVGAGHGAATCQGAAFEFISNVHKDLVKQKVRENITLKYLSNEPVPGDFGVRGLAVRKGDEILTSEQFIGAIFEEYGIEDLTGRAVNKVDENNIYWEDFDGNYGETAYDFAMLIPRFQGQPFDFIGKDGSDVSEKVANKAGFILVDGIYGLSNDILVENPDAWPSVYQNREYRNIFAAGIAFAPPGPISMPHTTPNGTAITPAPPRTGMVSGIIGRVVALNIIDLIKKGRMTHSERMSEMFAACIASMGDSLWDGAAATIIIYPVVPDMRRYPNESGRDMFTTHMEMGTAGAWMKRMLHETFIYKFKGNPGWKIIPE